MKIDRIEIENFGKLSAFCLDFASSGLTEILQENGYGKTTISQFIRVMLFGFDGESSKSAGNKEREILRPWNGQTYGGKLYFTANGKKYILTKKFEKKASDDKIELVDADTLLPSQDFSNNPGNELLEIDAASFKKTAYFGQGDLATEATSSIQGKTNIQGDPSDIPALDKLCEIIDNNLKTVNSRSKSSVVKVLQSQIDGINAKLRGRSALEHHRQQTLHFLEEKRDEEKELDKRRETMVLQRSACSKAERLARDQADYLEKKMKEKQRFDEWQEYKSFFSKGLPSLEEIKLAIDHMDEEESDVAKLEQLSFTDEDLRNLEALSQMFSTGVPSEEAVNKIRQAIGNLANLNAQKNKEALSKEEEEEYRSYSNLAGLECEDVEKLITQWSQYGTLKSEYERKEILYHEKERQAREEEKEEKKQNPVLPFAIMGGVLLLAGIGVMTIQLIAGILLAVCGVACLAFALLTRSKTPAEKNNEKQKALFEEKQILLDKKRELDDQRQILFQAFGKLHISTEEEKTVADLYDLKEKVKNYHRLADMKAIYDQGCFETKMNALSQQIRSFFFQYYQADLPEMEAGMVLDDLERRAKTFSKLNEQQKDYHDLTGSMKLHKEAVQAFFARYGFEAVEEEKLFLNSLDNRLDAICRAEKEYQNASKDLEEFLKDRDEEQLIHFIKSEDSMTPEELDEHLQETEEELKKIREAIKTYQDSIDQTENELDDLFELEREKELLEEKMTRANHYVKINQKTIEYLQMARLRFTQSYTKPIMNAFRNYISQLLPELADCFKMDANFQLTYEADLGTRALTSLSSGLRDIVSLCLRGAFLDVMYQGEKPCIILDDPFVNIDDEKMPLAKEWLRILSEEYQVIYFCCHQSRSLHGK